MARTLRRFLRGRKRVVALLASTLPLSLITLTLGWQLRQNSRINELVEQQALAISQVDDDLSLASLERMRSRLEHFRMIAPDLAGEEAKKMIQARFIAIKRRIQTSERIDEKARQDLASLIEVHATIDETGAGLLREHLKRRRPDWQILADLHGPSWGDFQTVFEPMAVKLVDQTLGLRNNAKPPASTPTVVRFQTDCDAKMVVTFRGGTWSAGSRAGVAMFDNQWHSEPIWELAFTPDGKSLAASGRDGGVQFWGLAERRPIGWIREDGKPTNRFAFIDARKMVLAGSTGIRRRDLDLNSSFDVGMEIGKGLGVAKVVASPNGTIAVSSYDGKIRLNGHWGNRTLVSDGQALALAISRDGKILASAGHSGTIQLWEAETGSKLRSLAGHAGPVNALVFSPGRGLLCSGGNDATVRTWDVDSGRLRATRSHQANVRCLAVAPDDSTLASAGDDGLTRLWDLDTDRPKGLPMAGHSSPILAAAFSADSRSLATGGSDATIRLWEVESGRTTELIRQRSYELIVQAPSSTAIPSPPNSLADAIRDQIPLSLRIVRDGLVLRERPILLSEGDLTIRAFVVGDEVSVQVGEAPPLILREIIPLSLSGEGRFGLIWPSGGRITELRLERRSQAVEPDRIEVADRDFARRRFAQARDRYRELATKSDTPVSAIQEAQFKAALCSLALSDDTSAREGFQAVAAQLTSAAERWPLVAACQLWLFQLRHNEKDEAEKTFTDLSARFQFEQLAEYIPIEIPSQICRQYSWPSMYFYFRDDPRRVDELRQAERIASFFQFPPESMTPIRMHLIDALFAASNEDGDAFIDEAIRLSEEIFQAPAVDSRALVRALDIYHWMLLNQKREAELLELLGGQIARLSSTPRQDGAPLRLFRSRVLAALASRLEKESEAHWAAAERDVETFFKAANPDDLEHYFYEAKLLQGFLAERRLGNEAARAIWRDGYLQARAAGKMSLLHASILGSLSGEMSARDFRAILDGVLKTIPENFTPMRIFKGTFSLFSNEIAVALRSMWTTPRGREYARKITFKTGISFRDYFSVQVNLSVAEIVRRGAFPKSMTEDEERFVWEGLAGLQKAYQSDGLSNDILYELTKSWFGQLGVDFRQSVLGKFSPRTKASLEFMLGRRYRQLKRPAEARTFLDQAVQDARACASPYLPLILAEPKD